MFSMGLSEIKFSKTFASFMDFVGMDAQLHTLSAVPEMELRSFPQMGGVDSIR